MPERIEKWYDSDNIIRYLVYVALGLGAGNGFFLTQIEEQTTDRYRAAEARKDFQRRDDKIEWLTDEIRDHKVRIRFLETQLSKTADNAQEHADFEARIRVLERGHEHK